MYYKIENKECEVYKKLHEMRSEELQFEKDNLKVIEEKVELKFDSFLGRRGQQSFGRVTSYVGFYFTEPEKVDLKVWKKADIAENRYVPNTRYKAGRDMKDFLNNGLKRHWFGVVYDNLGLEQPAGRVTFPYVEICRDVIVIYLDEFLDITDPNITEITKREFNELIDSISKTAAE